jgi:DNA-binding NarL/FixJ family response regulator
LSKAAPVYELIQAIRQVQAGERVIPGPAPFKVAEALTAREIQVLQLVAWGNGNKQVAAQLSIAVETVRMHMTNILAKLSANDRTHAVTIAVTRGLLRLGEALMQISWHSHSSTNRPPGSETVRPLRTLANWGVSITTL